MKFQIAQISSLEKVRAADSLPRDEIFHKTALAGERFSYQICMKSDCRMEAKVCADASPGLPVKLYLVRDAAMDLPAREQNMSGEDYITLEPGLMPDILIPLEEQGGQMTVSDSAGTLWVRADLPEDLPAGAYKIQVKLTLTDTKTIKFDLEQTMRIQVLPAALPAQRLIYTRWFYADCVAVQHHVEIFSEQHWALIDAYLAAAADMGINMILVPIHTPPLDTKADTARPCVQLVDIEKKGEKYEFSFDKFRRFVDLCKKNGIQYFEMAHMFSQWGAKCAPNIMVTENGRKDYLFGWHTPANSENYIAFLKQYIAALSEELAREGISQNTYFHISDEPSLDSLETYRAASNLIRPLIGDSKTFDALSNYAFYENGLVACPVTSVEHVHTFLDHRLENQWTYYCCDPEKVFPNSFLAMPSGRIRVLGFLLYKYDIKGFLHWGFNYYNSSLSRYPVNPYVTTSGDKSYPSGDPFVVYPGRDCVYPSIHGEVTYEAIQDMDVCFALEGHIGREAVIAMIDKAAGRDLRFDDYPRDNQFTEKLRGKMIEKIAETIRKRSLS